MKKGKWANLFGTVLAGATVTAVYSAAKKKAKKYGENPRKQKLIDLKPKDMINTAIKAVANTDEQTIDKIVEFIQK